MITALHSSQMLLRCVLPLAVLTCALRAEVVEFEIKAGKGRTVNLPSAADDSNFKEPRGYADHGRQTRRFVQSIEISNLGDKPLTGQLLTVDNRDLTSMEGLQRTLGLSSEPGRQSFSMERLFSFWKDHRSHAGTGTALANEPFAALNFWGYTLCGEDTQALARLAYGCEIPARHVQLNGHVVGEYRYDGSWHMVDGDQNAVYLKLDNRTLASADDLRADPFLGIRTRVFGKHSPQELSASAFNTALIEHIDVAEPKLIKLKTGPAPLNSFTLPAGETLVWHYDTAPATPVGKMLTEKPDLLRLAALASIEHRAIASNWQKGEGGVKITSPFPIWKAVNETTGQAVAIPAGEAAFRITVPTKSDEDKISVFSQCSQVALPQLHRGDNMVQLDAKDGKARVAVQFEPVKNVQLPSVKVSSKTANFTEPPSFAINSTPRAESIWWQVSTQRDFGFVAPSLEGVIPASNDLRFDALTDTFLSAGVPYFVRVKARAAGVWSEWSEPAEFRVAKPSTPTNAKFESAGGGFVTLKWKTPDKNAQFTVFGSNRRDFVPDIYTDTEIVEMDHLKVTKDRVNKNKVSDAKTAELDFVPQHRFYRIIAKGGNALSVPSALIELPAEFSKNLPPATILQIRTGKEGTKDLYRAKEMELPKAAK